MKLIFLIVSRVVSLAGLSRRESWWTDAEILMLRHQLAVAQREQPRVHVWLTWPDRTWLAVYRFTTAAQDPAWQAHATPAARRDQPGASVVGQRQPPDKGRACTPDPSLVPRRAARRALTPSSGRLPPSHAFLAPGRR